VRNPLVAPAIFLAGGIVVSKLMPFTPAEAAVCAGVFAAAAAMGCFMRRTWLIHFGTSLAMASFGLLNTALRPAPAAPTIDLGAGRITGCVVEPAVVRNGRLQFTLEIRPGANVRVSVPAGKDGTLPPPVPFGRSVTVDARLRAVRGYHNPGSFDLEQFNSRHGIFWYATVPRGHRPEVRDQVCASAWRRLLEDWRSAALARIDSLYPGDSYRSAMMRGLLLGDKSGIRQAWIDDFRRTGTYHALVISGSHITLVCGLFLLWRRYAGYGERTLLILSASAAWLYALLAGGDPPVLRAAAGFSLFAIACLFYRRASILNLLAAVTILFLVADPRQFFDASFQLSFLAVAAIGAFCAREEHARTPDPHSDARRLEVRLLAETLHLITRLPVAVTVRIFSTVTSAAASAWALFRLSAAVQTGLALPMAVYFHRLSITGLSANVLAVPVLSQAIPLGFLAIFTGWHWPAALAGWLLDRSQSIAAWHARLEPAWRIPDPPMWLSLALAVSLVLCAARLPRLPKLLAFAACLVLLALLVVHPFAADYHPGSVELTAIDVGQGESLLAALPDGEMVVIDGGGLPRLGRRESELFDIGEEVVSPYLWSRGIRRLAAVAVSHLHDDHAGGIEALLDNFRPRELWTGFTPDHPVWRRLSAKAHSLGITVRTLKQGDHFEMGGTRWDVLAPSPVQPWTGKPRNNDSLVLRLRHGRHTFLLTGDIEHGVEGRLIEEQAIGRVDVLKIAHHGSRLSSNPAFLDLARPSVALISAGQGNTYGLPHPSIVEGLQRLHTIIGRTDSDGLISVRSDGRYLTLEPARFAGGSWSLWDLF